MTDTYDHTAALGALLHTRRFGRAARLLPTCASTSDEAGVWARAQGGERAPEGAVVIADAQTRGRGRLGRTWFSPPGESLYLTLLLRPTLAPHRAPPLSLVAGVALAETIEALGLHPELKWPNDLLLDGRKVAGILTEMATSGSGIEHVLLGIGVNLHGIAFPDELAGRATSLALALAASSSAHAAPSRDAFAASLLDHLEVWYDRFLAAGPQVVVAAWKRRARRLGTRITVHSGNEHLEGLAEDVDDEGALWLRKDDGTRVRVVAGEIVVGQTR